jgi:hypothetical protein
MTVLIRTRSECIVLIALSFLSVLGGGDGEGNKSSVKTVRIDGSEISDRRGGLSARGGNGANMPLYTRYDINPLWLKSISLNPTHKSNPYMAFYSAILWRKGYRIFPAEVPSNTIHRF